ncbi:MAG: hypothetical protein J4F49_04680 [Rhodobacteraceae bacterium]|nr:hypothetical protein [Paracoccaceae bacterium]
MTNNVAETNSSQFLCQISPVGDQLGGNDVYVRFNLFNMTRTPFREHPHRYPVN